MYDLPPFLHHGPFPCQNAPALFDPPRRGSHTTRAYATRVEAAQRVCASCPVQPACAAYGTRHRIPGIWGGKARPAPQPPEPEPTPAALADARLAARHDDLNHLDHGTPTAWHREQRLGLPHCAPCRAWMAERSRQKRADAKARRQTAAGEQAA